MKHLFPPYDILSILSFEACLLSICMSPALVHITEQSWSTQNGFPLDEIKLEDVLQSPTGIPAAGAD